MTDEGLEGPDARPGCDCKVGRGARKYGLSELDAELRRRHEADASLRDLEAFVNHAILERAIHDADIDVVGSVDSVLETLTSADASAGRRTETRSRLAGGGVDVEAIESDFVSYQTVRTHLRDCLGIDTANRGEFTVDDARGTIEWSRSRNRAVIERTLERLRRAGTLDTGPLELSELVRVTCSDCGGTYPLATVLSNRRCECDDRG